MPETGYSRSPKIAKGALVQLLQDIIGVIPNIIVFQYNPTTLTRQLTPWDPLAVDQTQRGGQAPTVQPFDVQETFSSFKIELDATDDLEDGKVLAETTGIETPARRLAQADPGLAGPAGRSDREREIAGRRRRGRGAPPDRRADPARARPAPDPAGAGQDLLGRGDAVLA